MPLQESHLPQGLQVPRTGIRVWLFINDDWVRLLVEPGSVFEWTESGLHDEGSWRRISLLTCDADTGYVELHITEINRDCDGRHSSDRMLVATDTHVHPEDGLRVFVFENASSRQRDYFAEQAGY